MGPFPPPLAFFLLLFSGWINRQQQAVIDYLREENRILRAAYGPQRVRLTDDQRRRPARASPASSPPLRSCAGIVCWSPRSTTARRGAALVARAPRPTSRRSSHA